MLCPGVCLSVASRSSIESAECTELVFGIQATLGLSEIRYLQNNGTSLWNLAQNSELNWYFCLLPRHVAASVVNLARPSRVCHIGRQRFCGQHVGRGAERRAACCDSRVSCSENYASSNNRLVGSLAFPALHIRVRCIRISEAAMSINIIAVYTMPPRLFWCIVSAGIFYALRSPLSFII